VKYRVEAIAVVINAAGPLGSLLFTHDYNTELGAWFAMLTVPSIYFGSSPRMLDLQTGETIAWYQHKPDGSMSVHWAYPHTCMPGLVNL
jgi:hypothetical protein